MIAPKVSVIIPVYNAGEYIERCAGSLFSQSLKEIEFIFVDDFSSDNSVDLIINTLQDYPDRKEQVRIIRNLCNLGVGQSRQKGVDEAKGQYIIHCDADDWVDPDMYKTLYQIAIDNNADISVCDFVKEYDSGCIIVAQKPETDKALLFKQFSDESLHTSFCVKLISNGIAKNVAIEPDINHWEDFSVTPYLMLKARKIVYVNKAFYHYYISNTNSVTHTNTVRNINSSINAINSLLKKMRDDNLIDIVDPLDIYRLQWSAKKGFLLEPSQENIKLWQDTFPESNSHYKEIGIPVKFQFLTWLAIHNHYKALQFYKNMKSIL